MSRVHLSSFVPDMMLKFRESESEYLKQLLLCTHDCVPDVIWISGRSSTGKSSLVKGIINSNDTIADHEEIATIDYRPIYVDCVFFFTVKDLCSHICKTLDENWGKGTSSFVDLVNFLSGSDDKVLLVLDHCDHLLSFSRFYKSNQTNYILPCGCSKP